MIFYTRTGCHLCADVLPHVRRVARLLRCQVEIIDIDSSDELVVEYGLRVPVLTTNDGSVLAEGRFGSARIIRALLTPGPS